MTYEYTKVYFSNLAFQDSITWWKPTRLWEKRLYLFDISNSCLEDLVPHDTAPKQVLRFANTKIWSCFHYTRIDNFVNIFLKLLARGNLKNIAASTNGFMCENDFNASKLILHISSQESCFYIRFSDNLATLYLFEVSIMIHSHKKSSIAT